jgi:hypothetical protein
MPIVYQIYSNGGSGGPVNYSSPIATVTGTSYSTGPLSVSSAYRFAVRTMDTTTVLLEANTQANVCVRLDASGNDIGQVPNVPFAPVARATSGGGCLVAWSYLASARGNAPTAFLVYLTPGSTPLLTSPVATVTYQPGVSGYSFQLNGLLDSIAYMVSIVSQGAAGAASVATSTTVVGDSTAPGDVDTLTAVAVP